jgi:hypothetical protein
MEKILHVIQDLHRGYRFTFPAPTVLKDLESYCYGV